MNRERYHLTLSSAGRAVAHGWWGDRRVADGKFTEWVGSFGDMPDARVTLVDEEAGETLTTWPART